MQTVTRKLLTILLLPLSVAALLLLFSATQVMAAGDDPAAQGGVSDDAPITADDLNGLLATDAGSCDPWDISINSNGGAITLGAVAARDSINLIEQAGNAATVAVTTSSANNLVTFAGDLHVISSGDTFTINATNTTTLFQGDAQTGGGVMALVVGAGSTTAALTTTFDTSTAADNAIAMTINANHANNVITLAVTNTNATAGNEIVFAKTIGNANAIDVITLGAVTEVDFTLTVVADLIKVYTTRTTTFLAGAIVIVPAAAIVIAAVTSSWNKTIPFPAVLRMLTAVALTAPVTVAVIPVAAPTSTEANK